MLTEGTTVRLRNSVTAAAETGILPYLTVAEYIAAGAMAIPNMMRKVPNFGAKTARELDAMLKASAETWTRSNKIATTVKDGSSPEEVLEFIGHISIRQATEGEILSVRLENGLAAPEIQSMRVSTVALNLETFLTQFRRLPNVGRISARELTQLMHRLVPRLLAQNGVAHDQIVRTCSTLFGHMDAEALCSADDVPMHETLAECLDWLLSQCKDRDREVVRRRFSIERADIETLEEIGADFGVTRERIRQIEKRALGRMRVRMRRVPIADHVKAASKGAWLEICEGRGWITDRRSDVALRKLEGKLQLALELLRISPHAWLSEVAERSVHGWIGSPLDPDPVKSAAAELASILKLPLPRSVRGAPCADAPAEVEAALRVHLGLELEQGYVVQSKPGVRMRRALGLHRLLVSASSPLPADRLIPQYHRLCPSDLCSPRDAEIVMLAAPHLFIETYDQVWFGIGVCGSPPVLDAPCAVEGGIRSPFEQSDTDSDEETCAASLMAALERRGPERLVTLYQNAKDILPAGRSPNSVGPTLLTNAHIFSRLLPGIYGLPHQVPSAADLLSDPPLYLLDNMQLRLMALARRAGERREVFPLWSLQGEFALARWGYKHGAPDSLRSLLAVADIDAWPISASERSHWRDVARREGRFELAEPLRPDAYVRPDLDRLLAACIELANTGKLNWMSVNRMAGRRIDSQVGASTIAILLGLGAVRIADADPAAWQRSHEATDRSITLRDEMSDELSSTGVASWERGIGLRLAGDILAAAPEIEGWPDADRLAAMFDAESDNSASEEGRIVDPLDAIMAERRQLLDRQKREDLLRWLLEE
ncbi:sigma factor-like helix-turn-helix DNA-binding protein [Falsiroseomonas sp. E2-1-a4]|uniref:sigma factor-like helix-turn-helix DNA-binding protein n=1 Tax=Falsiroseomonas sp. E2-1-a4 TaxID=3239299 RepID=UPI003F3D34E2